MISRILSPRSYAPRSKPSTTSVRIPLFRRVLLAAALLACGLASSSPLAADPVPAARRTPVVEVFQSCKDAVVNISCTQVIKVQSPIGIDSLFEQLFDLPNSGLQGPTRQLQRTSVGSGFVIHADGYIVTNAHVVSRTADQKVTFADKREYDAKIVAIDAQRDLAVLKIAADHPLKTIKLGRSSDLMVGETVIAIGNPLGYQNTVTAGVVSALDRTIQINDQLSITGLIQTDASINPGNSGGPLLNVLGELIGINSAIRGDAQNIGFAIPVDHFRQALPLLLDAERRQRIITGLRVGTDGPASIVALEKGSPADAAHLSLGDVITRINDSPVASGVDYLIALLNHQRGDTLKIQYARGGKPGETTLTLGGLAKPDGTALLKKRFGITAEPMTDKLAREMNLRRIDALVVKAVEEDSPAARLGLVQGDIIDHLDGAPTGSLDAAGTVLELVQPDQGVAISVLRIRGQTIFRTQTAIQAR